ncbi:MAG: TetR/AcrR family transcriptional regulator [Alphaproteobacteria bacterium]|nr:MAG: TetR/AcrR family transcriptional regulator [Alphaproteobacteria bacterium]
MPSSKNAKTSKVAWRRRKDQREPEILAAARVVLEENGIANTSVAMIAARAGVSEATVYKYFDNKQDLINRVLVAWATPFVEVLEREIKLVKGIGGQLTLVAIRYLRGMQQTPRVHRLYYQELKWENYFGSPLHQINRRFSNIVVSVIRKGIDSGELKPDIDPLVTRDILFGGLEHIGQRTIFAGRPLDVEREASKLVSQILGGIRRTAGPDGGGDSITRLNEIISSLQLLRNDILKNR